MKSFWVLALFASVIMAPVLADESDCKLLFNDSMGCATSPSCCFTNLTDPQTNKSSPRCDDINWFNSKYVEPQYLKPLDNEEYCLWIRAFKPYEGDITFCSCFASILDMKIPLLFLLLFCWQLINEQAWEQMYFPCFSQGYIVLLAIFSYSVQMGIQLRFM
eukprot:TRINITY_DN2001_c0_g2_i1.p1 TRINITY_DN2001_c0_g2~~TRINITY_DN2001_c0_g2_i1.p1  ORF type:complete len:161 (+),score=6.54 TRINITY_DN2001_c0_g2_i1:54-536(+)